MAKSPQLEDGFMKIATELAVALSRINLSAYEARVLWCIFVKTYGWQKKTDRISFSQFEELTQLKRWHIARTLNLLVDRNIIIRKGSGQTLEYGIQKDYDLWKNTRHSHTKPLPNEVTKTITSPGNEPLPNQVTETVTYPGNEPLPNQVMNVNEKPLPIQEKPLPIGVELLPIGVTKPLPIQVTTKERKQLQKHITKESIPKKKFGEFQNVFLTDTEYLKLIKHFGEQQALRRIENMSLSIEQHGYKYKSHYAAILNWARNDDKKQTFRPVPKPSQRVTGRTQQYTEEDYLEGIQ